MIEAFNVPIDRSATPTQLTGAAVDGKYFNPTHWSPDGARRAGIIESESGRPVGLGIYDLATHKTTVVNADEPYAVKWLADSASSISQRTARSSSSRIR